MANTDMAGTSTNNPTTGARSSDGRAAFTLLTPGTSAITITSFQRSAFNELKNGIATLRSQ